MKPSRRWLVASGASLTGFVLLALVVTSSSLVRIVDDHVQDAVLGLRSAGLTPLMQALTTLGSLPFVVGAAVSGIVLLAWRTRDWPQPAVLGLTVGLGAATVAVLKLVVARPRPAAEDRIGPAALDFAFPSGHTGDGSITWCAVTLLVGLTLPRSPRRTAAFVVAVMLSFGIGLSRVYLGYHWPTDVLGSWLLASTFVCGTAYVVLRLRRRDLTTGSAARAARTEVERSAVRESRRS